MNAPYRMTSHTHGEEELKPWFEPLKTGTTAVDCALLHALDGAWGARHEAEHTPRRPIADPEWLKAAEGRPLHWDDFIPRCSHTGIGMRDNGRDCLTRWTCWRTCSA